MQFKISNSEREYFKFVDLGGLRKLRLVETQIIHNLASELNSKHLDRVQILYYQKLVCYLFNSNLVKNLSKKKYRNTKAKITIPKLWQKYFKDNGFALSKNGSNLKFTQFLIIRLVGSILLAIFYSLPARRSPKLDLLSSLKKQGYNVVYLNRNMSTKYILDFGNSNLNCFSNWYKKYSNTDKIIYIHHIKELKKSPDPNYFYLDFPRHVNTKYIKFLQNSFLIFMKAFKKCLHGNINELFCIADLVLAKRSEFIPNEFLPNVLIFNESNSILRPLFSYALEGRGCATEVFNFSTSDNVKLINEEQSNFPMLLQSWSMQIVYDKHSEKISGRSLLNQKVSTKIINDIPNYTDKLIEFPQNGRKNLALFDIRPKQHSFGSSTLCDIHVTNNLEWKEFILVFFHLASELNLNIFYKPKRNQFSDQQSLFIERLNRHDFFYMIDHNVSPRTVLQNSFASVSSTVTTPGFIAKEMGVPSAFYNSNPLMYEYDQTFRGLRVLSSNSEAYNWVKKFCF